MTEPADRSATRPPRRELTTSAAVAAVSGATYISLGVGILRGLLYTSVLTPTSRGIVQIVFLFGKYLSYSHLGITHGLTKRVPILLGQEREAEADELEQTGITAVFLLTLAAAGVMWGYALLASSVGTATRLAIAFGGFHLLFAQMGGVYRVVLRSRHHFGIIARATILEAILLLALVVAGSQLLDAPGTMVGWALGLGVVCLYLLSFRRIPGVPRFSLPTSITLAKIGLPVLGVGLAESFMRTADSLVVAKMLGAEALGYYGLAWQLASYLYNVPASAGFVIMPKILRAHGEGGDEAARRSVLEMTRVMAILMPPLAGLGALTAPVVIRLILKDYLDAIPPVEILILAVVLTSLPTALTSTLIAKNRELELIAWQALAGLVSAGAVSWLITREASLGQIALGASAGWLVGGLTITWRGVRCLGEPAMRTTAFVSGLLVPFAYSVGVLFGLKWVVARWLPGASPDSRDLLAVPVYVALAAAPLAWYVERTTGLLSRLRSRGAPAPDTEEEPPPEVDSGP